MNMPTCHKPAFESALISLAHEAANASWETTIMAKIKVIKSGKESAKPVNYCPWVIDSGEPVTQK